MTHITLHMHLYEAWRLKLNRNFKMKTSFTKNNKLNIRTDFIKENRNTFHIELYFQVNTHKSNLFHGCKVCNQDNGITV